LVKLLQRIRDESHRFAVSYHSTLRSKRQVSSLLDDLPGVGPATRKKLIKYFGSTSRVIAAPASEIQQVVGRKTGDKLARQLKALNRVQ
jgi:excinuclease ABC subunit C